MASKESTCRISSFLEGPSTYRPNNILLANKGGAAGRAGQENSSRMPIDERESPAAAGRGDGSVEDLKQKLAAEKARADSLAHSLLLAKEQFINLQSSLEQVRESIG